MEKLVIRGKKPLKGEVSIPGAKNSALPILAASLLVEGKCTISNVPYLKDVSMMIKILESLGANFKREADNVHLDCSDINSWNVPDDLVRTMRSSIFLMGPLLARFKKVKIVYPGGCAIGTRAIDLHIKGLASLGAKIDEKFGYIEVSADKLKGSEIYLDYPSVGATENVMLAAVKAEGTTIIKNAAREPEIIDLANFLNNIGAKVKGAGTAEIKIYGTQKAFTKHCQHDIIPDRIVAGTVMVGAAMTGGDVKLNDVIPPHLESVMIKLKEMGATISKDVNSIRVKGNLPLKAVDLIRTAPYPGFPTDMQPQMMIALTMAKGSSLVSENVFDGRFKHVGEFRRMGAQISTDNRTAVVRGVDTLRGALVESSDLRAGAALVLAGLAAENITIITNIHHIDRGYEQIEALFTSLGGDIKRVLC
ncbi:UDP-N-acetylglucosamine 1-carboxyvinyltransferase [Proteinivorax hydrogeniformans]|uniref:UDP-N-acetylglucosamine 1-carboxyvinyltransferase n=1 Tax=Proteinivorax hydrogeniformans TaxID=1826727 RepID=A0AAU8HR32_9FIRM